MNVPWASIDSGESRMPLRERWPRDDWRPLVERLQNKIDRLVVREGDDSVEALLQWIESLYAGDPASALAVAERLDQVLALAGSADAAGHWILTGQRMYPADRERQRQYYRLEDPRAVESLHAEAAAIDLHAAAASLSHLLSALAQRDLVVQPRSCRTLHGLALRPILTRTHLLLPDSYTALDGSDRLGLYSAAVAHAVAHLRFSLPAQSAAGLKPLAVAVISAVEDSRVEQLLTRELPGVRRWFTNCMLPAPPPGDLSFGALIRRLSRALACDTVQDDSFWVEKARGLFAREREAAGLEDVAAFRRLANILANDLGQMRVRFDPQQYVVPMPYRDDNSYLWSYDCPPPAEQELVEQVAPHRRAAGDNPGDLDEPRAVPGPTDELGRFTYPEWDRRIEVERPAWCTVVERPVHNGVHRITLAPAETTGMSLPPLRSSQISRQRRLRRQWEGDDLDLNAVIEVTVDRRLQVMLEPRLFMRSGREQSPLALLVLLDLSESANDRIGGTMRSILDVEKQAAMMLVRSFNRRHAANDCIAVHAFASNTRAEVNYWKLLDFDAPPCDDALAGIAMAQAALSTRMGAALRHATALLRGRRAGRRALLVITDGSPSDVDVSDPSYLTEDAAAAVAAARRFGVECACVAVDPNADAYVRNIFGWRNYRVIDDAATLPAQLSALYLRVLAR